MTLPEYDRLDATALAALVAAGEVSPAELLEAAIERADARDPALGAIVHRFDAEARAAARGELPRGAFRGVPFLVKDLSASVAGQPLAWGSRLLAGHVSERDSGTVQRLRAAGLVLFGTTKTSELGLLPVTEPELGGPCRNPWDLSRTAGGSSGGSAAAVAARIVPMAHGSDGGGSLRVPASACGVFALKPTRGRVSADPDHEAWSGLSSQGVLARSVRDAAAALDAVAGPAPGDPYRAAPPERPYRDEVGAPPGRLRVAFTRRALLGGDVHPECVAAVDGAARLLADLGHVVAEDAPPLAAEALLRAMTVVVCSNVAEEVREASRRSGRRPSAALLEPSTLGAAAVGELLPAAQLVAALRTAHAARRALAAFHERYDLLLTPTVPEPPPPLGSMRVSALDRAAVRALAGRAGRLAGRALVDRLLARMAPTPLRAVTFTAPFNMTGQPAASVPLHWTAGGLPVAVQLAAPLGGEATLVRVAAQLEAARPWADRTPPIA